MSPHGLRRKNCRTSESVELSAEINWVACSDETCLPGDAALSFKMDVKPEAPAVNERHTALFASAREKLPQTAPKISATQQANSITLVVPHKDQSVTAAFFPESDQPLDIKGEITVKPHADLPNHHVIELTSTSDTSQLKGVLVTQGKGEKKPIPSTSPWKKGLLLPHPSFHLWNLKGGWPLRSALPLSAE